MNNREQKWKLKLNPGPMVSLTLFSVIQCSTFSVALRFVFFFSDPGRFDVPLSDSKKEKSRQKVGSDGVLC